jgi:hypothetical protein
MSFREAVLQMGGTPYQVGGIFGWGGKQGSAPPPFDGVERNRLAGPSGSHPLAALSAQELLRPTTDGLDGSIEILGPVRVGDGIHGRLRLTARRDIRARGAMLRLVGVRLAEEQRSEEKRDSEGRVTSSESWVEVHGKAFEQLPFASPPLPAALAAGQSFEGEFTIPAPRLGPASGHMGSALIAWAVEARWDVSMGSDERVAALVDVAQNIDYLRSGAVTLGAGAMFDAYGAGDASIAVRPLPPALAGKDIDVTVNWPGAGGGRGARIELQADVEGPTGLKGIVLASVAADPAQLRDGLTVTLSIPADAPPTQRSQGVGVSYRLRALVDRPLRKDLAVERALAVM